MSEINVELTKTQAISLLPPGQITIKMLRNGKVGDVSVDSVLALMKRSEQIGFNAQGEAYRLGLSLWIKHSGGVTDYFESVKDKVDQLSLSLGINLPH